MTLNEHSDSEVTILTEFIPMQNYSVGNLHRKRRKKVNTLTNEKFTQDTEPHTIIINTIKCFLTESGQYLIV